VGAVIAFSTTDKASFEALASWKAKVEAQCPKIAMVLVQNKVDLIDQAVVTPAEVEASASTLHLRLHRVSVKENLNVTELFEYLAGECVKIKRAGAAAEPSVGGKTGDSASSVPPIESGGAFKIDGASSGSTTKKPKKKSTCMLL
jgi:Ras-related protein Rab-23